MLIVKILFVKNELVRNKYLFLSRKIDVYREAHEKHLSNTERIQLINSDTKIALVKTNQDNC